MKLEIAIDTLQSMIERAHQIHDGHDDRILVRVVLIERPDGHTGPLCNLGCGRQMVAIFGQNLNRRFVNCGDYGLGTALNRLFTGS